MTVNCPTCGAPVNPSSLLVDVENNSATRLGTTVHLQPAEIEILSVLNRAFPRRVLIDRLLFALYGDGTEPEYAEKSVAVRITKMRTKLAPLGISFPVGLGGYCVEFAGHPHAFRPKVLRPWTEAEIKILRAAWHTSEPTEHLARRLGRRTANVRVKAYSLGLSKRHIFPNRLLTRGVQKVA